MANYNLYWWRGREYNFGDEITPWLFNKMFNFHQSKPCNLKDTSKPTLLAVGSIMRLSAPSNDVWGSGIRNIDQSDFKGSKKYHAVRGMFSRDQLLKLGHDCPAVYGDPGVLLPKYYFPKVRKKYKLGIIPHVIEYDELNLHFKKFKDVKVIDLRTNNIESVVNDILSCDSTISSSLHGVITSVAYNIPTRWLKYSDKITGDDIKFYDFFSSLDSNVFSTFDRKNIKSTINKYNPIKFQKHQDADFYAERTYLYDMFDVTPLIKSCPFKSK